MSTGPLCLFLSLSDTHQCSSDDYFGCHRFNNPFPPRTSCSLHIFLSSFSLCTLRCFPFQWHIHVHVTHTLHTQTIQYFGKGLKAYFIQIFSGMLSLGVQLKLSLEHPLQITSQKKIKSISRSIQQPLLQLSIK